VLGLPRVNFESSWFPAAKFTTIYLDHCGQTYRWFLPRSCRVACVHLCRGVLTFERSLSVQEPLPNPERRRGEDEECSVLEFKSLQGLGLVTSEFWREAAFFCSRSVGSSRDQTCTDPQMIPGTCFSKAPVNTGPDNLPGRLTGNFIGPEITFLEAPVNFPGTSRAR